MSEGAVRVEPGERRASRAAALRPWLAHPLLIAIVGAVLVNWLIPQLTRDWQDHAKGLDIQTDLVGEMSESVSTTVTNARILAQRLETPAAQQQAFNDGTRTWAVRSAVIGSQLQAYFPKTEIGADWRSFAGAVESYFQLAAVRDAYRQGHVERIQTALRARVGERSPGWRVLARQDSGPTFLAAYAQIGFALLARNDELVQRVLESEPAGL